MPTISNSDLKNINIPTQFNYHKPKNINNIESDKHYQAQPINTETEDNKTLQTTQIDILDSIDTTQPHVHDDNNEQSESHKKPLRKLHLIMNRQLQ